MQIYHASLNSSIMNQLIIFSCGGRLIDVMLMNYNTLKYMLPIADHIKGAQTAISVAINQMSIYTLKCNCFTHPGQIIIKTEIWN